MAVTFLTGFEGRDAALDGITLTGAVYQASNARTGVAMVVCNAAPGVAKSLTIQTPGNYTHFGLRIVGPTSAGERVVFGQVAAGTINVRVSTTYTLAVYLNTTLIGTSAALTSNTWAWVGVRQVTGTSVAFLQVDGVDAVTGTATVSAISGVIGLSGTEASNALVHVDDIIVDNAGFLAPSGVIDLLPTADSAIGTGWTLGSGGTTGLWDAVNNQPPTAVLDPGTTAQIRNAASAASSNYDATLQTYASADIFSADTVLAVQPVISTGAPVTTSSKQGLVGNASNPAITTIALGAGGTAGAFWSGVAAGTWPTGWKTSFGTLTTSPSVTVHTAPVMRVTQVTSSTRIAMVAYMALRVAWTRVEPAGTTIYPTDTASDVSTASVDREAWTSRGAGVQTDVTNTATGPTGPIQVTDTAGGTVVDWFTRPLTAFTLSISARVNVRALESAGAANAAIGCEIARVEGDGTSATVWGSAAPSIEIQPVESAASFRVGGADLAISQGQRLRVRFYLDDAPLVMASGFTVTLYYAGAAGATGDTFLTFSQALTEYVAPAAGNPPFTQPYPPILAQ